MEDYNKIKNHDEILPSKFHLSQNYPNPFSCSTVIKYCVPQRSNILITILNPERFVIEILLDRELNAGTYEIEIKANDLPEGEYYYRLESKQFYDEKKMEIRNK